jgi:glycosyltransferase involved in cell wall biosynthesis
MSKIEPVTKPKLSVVLASQNACRSVSECLGEIEKQRNEGAIEIIVVDNSIDGTQDVIARNFPNVKLVRASKDKFIPELWGIGINQSAGDYIAVTTTHFVPSKNWIAEILKKQEAQYAGVGGAIENDDKAGLVSWAVYFCRYSRYMLPFADEDAEDFAADNASYKRDGLEHVKHTMENGFWEVTVHQAMKKEKMSLLLTPDIVVYHHDSFTFRGFIRQRFWHGRQFGSTRASSIPASKRAMLVLLSPLIPFIYLYRITRRVFTRKRNIDKYLLSLPVLFLFLVSWSWGEFNGYLWKSKE